MEKRVLVVDDDAPTRSMVAAVLTRAAFTVDLCENGDEALAHLESARYGVLVLSLVRRNPVGDAAILSRLKASGRPPCVVVISAGSQTALDEIDSDLIAARLRKPFQIDDLVVAVTRCFAEA